MIFFAVLILPISFVFVLIVLSYQTKLKMLNKVGPDDT